MAESPAGQQHHRGVRAVQRMVEYAPGSGGLALWVRHCDVEADLDDATDGAPVYTDGVALHYRRAFASLPLEEQTGWVAHEVLHVALRHAQRFEALARRTGDADLQLFNRCADAIVNSALSHLGWLALPAGAIRLESVLEEVLGEPAAGDEALLEWDVERLYAAVDDRGPVDSDDGRTADGRRGRGSGSGSGSGRSRREDPRAGDGQAPAVDRRDGPRAARVRALGAAGQDDLQPAGHAAAPEREAEDAREWLQRLLRAHAGDGDASLLRSLLADLPRTRTPWEQVLRVQAARALARRPGTSWSRPSRSYLANQGRTRQGRRMPWEPGTTASRAAPRLALVLDVSGSIDDALLQRFGREIDAIVRRHEAPLVLVIGDLQVREVVHVKQGEPVSGRLAAQGGGGTDFEPLIAEALCHRPDLIVVLTDLDGPTGPAPRCPLIWAVPAAAKLPTPPFGRVLPLD